MCSKGLPREPKYSHLTKLHKVIKLCEPALVSVDPTVTWLGDKLEVMDTIRILMRKEEKDSKIIYLFVFCFSFRLRCSSPSHLARLFSQTTMIVMLQESRSGDQHMICLLGLSVFYLTAKPSTTTLQR